MKQLLGLSLIALVSIAAVCCSNEAIICTDVPERQKGQQDMIQYAAPAIDTVRVGFIGLGMRGPSAVWRMCHIEGADIVALCDVVSENVEKCQEILTKNGRHQAAAYSGDEDVWKQLCDRMILI